jgi:hypothetical protein
MENIYMSPSNILGKVFIHFCKNVLPALKYLGGRRTSDKRESNVGLLGFIKRSCG